jgi:hypothetical protein
MFARFVAALPPDADVVRLDGDALAAERVPFLPNELAAFYADVGVGGFGGGALFVLPPHELWPALDLWLNHAHKRIPFARTAFGELFYWRDLRDEAAAQGMTGENPGELGDVSVVDVHYAAIDVAALGVVEFFDGFADPDVAERVLRLSRVQTLRERLGPLRRTEQYAFVPALGLGGSEDGDIVDRCDFLVHCSLLRQLV